MKTIPRSKPLIQLAIIWTICWTPLLDGCAQIDLGNQVGDLNSPIDSGTETGDSGTQAVFEGGALAPYRCLRDPRGKPAMDEPTDAPMKIWLDSSQLFNCYGSVSPPCHALAGLVPVYSCRTEELGSHVLLSNGSTFMRNSGIERTTR